MPHLPTLALRFYLLAFTLDTAEASLLAVFLRRYVIYCARRGKFAAMNGAARLYAEIARAQDSSNKTKRMCMKRTCRPRSPWSCGIGFGPCSKSCEREAGAIHMQFA